MVAASRDNLHINSMNYDDPDNARKNIELNIDINHPHVEDLHFKEIY